MKQLGLLVMAPIMGGLFVVFLPMIGFALFGYVIVAKLARLWGRRAPALA